MSMDTGFSFSDYSDGVRHASKMDTMGQWIERAWIAERAEQDWITLWVSCDCVHEDVIAHFDADFALPDGYHFAHAQPIACPVVVRIVNQTLAGDLSYQSGAFIYHFARGETGETLEVLVMASYFTDDSRLICLVCMPRTFIPVWTAFAKECERRCDSLMPDSKVIIIGGRTDSFVPTVTWDEIILPDKLKADLLEDVQSFFTKGVGVYKRLNLKPFRKLLLAGVPGTGKTMLCSALAKWAIELNYLVIYISSADRQGATFGKIQQAINIASKSSIPTLILLEELDAYLNEEEKSLVLNVLDGSESAMNEQGTLLVATTNYPEAIDERVLKRPGRLDRIFIIPETRQRDEAERMLRQYLGDLWQDEHRALVPHLVGYPGAFIREVAVYALTLLAYEDLSVLSLDVLERSFHGLKEQIEAKQDFLTQRSKRKLGLAPEALVHRSNGDFS